MKKCPLLFPAIHQPFKSRVALLVQCNDFPVKIQQNGVVLETQLSEYVPVLLADRIQLQVILNLIMNAIEAMSGVGEGPRELLVRSGTDGSEHVAISVQCRTQVWGLIRRAWNISSRPSIRPSLREWGWGSRSAARLLRITAGGCGRSANPDKGATFQFTLPTGGGNQHD